MQNVDCKTVEAQWRNLNADVHFDFSFYHQAGNGRQLLAVLADETGYFDATTFRVGEDLRRS